MIDPHLPTYVVARRYAAVWLQRSGMQSQVRRAAEQARLAGRPDVASDLEELAAQLRELGRGISDVGNAELVEPEIESEWNRPPSLGLPVADAAALLGVSDRRVTQWLTDGTLSGVKESGRWVVDRESVDALIVARSA